MSKLDSSNEMKPVNNWLRECIPGIMCQRLACVANFGLFLFLPLFVAACSLTTPEELPVEEILVRAIERTARLEGFSFSMVREGVRAYFDPDETISLRRVEGVFVAPDAVQALVRVITPGVVSEFQILSLGDRQWFTNLGTGAWEVVPAEWGFNPATLFEPENGMAFVLEADIIDPVLEGTVELDELPGRKLYYIVAQLSGEHIYYLSYGMIASPNMQVELWIQPITFEIHRIVLTEALPDETETRIWQLDFWDFDREIEITAPDV